MSLLPVHKFYIEVYQFYSANLYSLIFLSPILVLDNPYSLFIKMFRKHGNFAALTSTNLHQSARELKESPHM